MWAYQATAASLRRLTTPARRVKVRQAGWAGGQAGRLAVGLMFSVGAYWRG